MINEDKIRKACSSDRERGFRLLVDSFQEPIYNYIRRMVVSHEDAEDVLQEVFIRVFRHLDQFRNESSLSTWIYRIATNECLRLLNSRKEEVISAEDVQEELMSKLKASDYVDYEDELAVKFQEAILTLPEKQRIVFNLCPTPAGRALPTLPRPATPKPTACRCPMWTASTTSASPA